MINLKIPSFTLPHLSFVDRWVILGITSLLPILLFLPVVKGIGAGAAYPAFLLPISAAAVFFGARAGAISGILFIPVGLALTHLAFPGRQHIALNNLITGLLFSSIGACMGYIRDLQIQVQSELKNCVYLQAGLIEASKFTSLGQMAAGLSHEVNTPLTVILGNLVYLKRISQENENSDRILGALNTIENHSKKISQLIVGLQAFSHDAGNDHLEPKNMELLLNDVVFFFSTRFRDHQIQFELTAGANVGEIECRPKQLSQVFLSLIANSVDAIIEQSERWIKVHISDESQFLEISFTDSGSGIPKINQLRIMEPFFTTKKLGKGTGLGLSVAKGVIESHQGTLILDSKSANTRFLVRIPKNQFSSK